MYKESRVRARVYEFYRIRVYDDNYGRNMREREKRESRSRRHMREKCSTACSNNQGTVGIALIRLDSIKSTTIVTVTK